MHYAPATTLDPTLLSQYHNTREENLLSRIKDLETRLEEADERERD